MLIGTSLFICDDCKAIFKGLYMERNMTPLAATQQCVKCGSWHTMPGRHLDSPDREIYVEIWKQEDETGYHGATSACRIDKLEKCLKECDEWNSVDRTKELEEMDAEEARRRDSPEPETFMDQCLIAIFIILYLPFYLYEVLFKKKR